MFAFSTSKQTNSADFFFAKGKKTGYFLL